MNVQSSSFMVYFIHQSSRRVRPVRRFLKKTKKRKCLVERSGAVGVRKPKRSEGPYGPQVSAKQAMDSQFKRDFPLLWFYQICFLKSIFSRIWSQKRKLRYLITRKIIQFPRSKKSVEDSIVYGGSEWSIHQWILWCCVSGFPSPLVVPFLRKRGCSRRDNRSEREVLPISFLWMIVCAMRMVMVMVTTLRATPML